jgi:flagellar hook-length control protein FliK
VALSLTKLAQNGKAGETDRYRLQLDPPEMGRLDIEMDFLDSGKVKTVIMVDKPETLAMLQKDMNTLIKAMQDAGFENMSQNDLSFSLSQDNAGDHANNKGDNGRGHSSSDMMDGDLHILESEMSIIIDPETGQKHVNMLV